MKRRKRRRRAGLNTATKIKIAAAIAAYPIIMIALVGISTVCMTVDRMDNMLHGRYGDTTESKLEHFLDNMDESLLARFERDGGSIMLTKTDAITVEDIESRGAKAANAEIIQEKGATGVYSHSEQVIRIADDASNGTFYHEFGHYIDDTLGMEYLGHKFSESESFCIIAENEIADFNKKMHHYNASDYSLRCYELSQKFSEYFAESFECYLMSPRYLKYVAPATYAYMDALYQALVQ